MRVLKKSFCVLALLAALTLAVRADAAETVVLSAPPEILRADVESGVLLLQKAGDLCADDLDTGATLWTRPIPKNENREGVSVGLHQSILFASSGQLSVLDNKTGKESMRLNVSAGQGELKYASLAGDDQWVFLSYEGASVLCELATRRRFRLPMAAFKSIGGSRMPDGKTLLITEVLGDETPPIRAQVWYWEPGVAEPVAGCVLESTVYMYLTGVLPGGELLLREYDLSDSGKHGVRIVNPTTGATLRVMEWPNPPENCSGSTQDCSRWFDYDKASNTLNVQDMLSGAPLFSLQLPGRQSMRVVSQPREAGKDWILAWEENNNVWLVPLEEGGVPRRVLDGSRYLPGPVQWIMPPYLFCELSSTVQGLSTKALYFIEGFEKIREWSFKNTRGGVGCGGLSADKKILLGCEYLWGKGGGPSHKTMLAGVGNETPLLVMEGEALALSSDGRHILVRKGENQVLLVRVDNGQVVKAFLPEKEHYPGVAVFSPDSRRAAVFHYPKLTVVDLEEGYPEKEMVPHDVDSNFYIYNEKALCFSPDGTLLLGAGNGWAWLFNAVTGEHLHTFAEERRFAEPYHFGQGGFMKNLRRMASDYVGKVTDRYKRTPQLTCAFTMDGLRVVTVAQSMLARVWDVRTGGEVATIKTGLPETRNKGGTIENRHVLSDNGAYLFAYNSNGYGVASLWDTASGRKIKEYRLPEGVYIAVVAKDGRSVYVMIDRDVHILPGRN